MMKKYIRVGEKNNFNFTKKEIVDLQENWSDKGLPFVNSNSLVRITNDFPSVITINPYFFFVEPIGDTSNIKACRIKIVCGAKKEFVEQEKKAIDWCVENGIPILVTYMRFKRLIVMNKFIEKENRKMYVFNHSWLRPTNNARQARKAEIKEYLSEFDPHDQSELLYICDEDGRGCPSCNNCARLTYGEKAVKDGRVHSLNLSSSGDNGVCMFHCPDCFAKEVLNLCVSKRPACDKLIRNRKQRGGLIHD